MGMAAFRPSSVRRASPFLFSSSSSSSFSYRKGAVSARARRELLDPRSRCGVLRKGVEEEGARRTRHRALRPSKT
eukprot:527575-Pyramimonas_sp.AAC.1